MKPTMELDMQLVYNIANTLGLIADGLMDGHLVPNVGDEAKALEVKKNLIKSIDAHLSGIETAAHLEMSGSCNVEGGLPPTRRTVRLSLMRPAPSPARRRRRWWRWLTRV